MLDPIFIFDRHQSKKHITSHRIASHRITSHRIASHHITSHRITSHRIASHHITSHRIASHHIASHHIPRPSLFLTPSLFLIAHDQSRIKTQVKNKDNRGQKNLPQSPPAETSRHQPKSVAISRNQSPSAEISRHHQPKSVATSHRGGGGPFQLENRGARGPPPSAGERVPQAGWGQLPGAYGGAPEGSPLSPW